MIEHGKTQFQNVLGGFIFFSRWLQAPLYLGLIAAQAIYVYQFFVELVHLTHKIFGSHAAAEPFTEKHLMLAVLGLIDVVMIANLLIMVIVGGYETFVSRLRLEGHPDQPEWLSHVNAGVLKVKLATALIGISSIHLLKTFIEIDAHDTVNTTAVISQVGVHLTFVISALLLAYTDRISTSTAISTRTKAHQERNLAPLGDPAEFPSIDAALTECILRAETDGIALEEALENLGPASFCFACMLLAMPFLQPIPLGPYTMASGLTFIACGWQMVQGRQIPLLPKGMRNARLHGKGWVAALKLCQRVLRFGRKFTRRRQEARVSGRAGEQLVGWFILCGGALLAIPAANLPFNNIFPALMILCAALAWLERDGLLIVFSLFFGALSVVYFVAVLLLLWFFGTEIFAWIKTLLPGAGT